MLLFDQVDILGHSIFDFTHPCDHDELNDLISDKNVSSHNGGTSQQLNEDKQRAVFVRMKCTLTSKGRNINIKSASYKVLNHSVSSFNLTAHWCLMCYCRFSPYHVHLQNGAMFGC